MRTTVNQWSYDFPNVYFSADSHHNHDNIIKFCNRPFPDAKEMDRVILSNINAVVQKDDALFLLGDFCFHNRRRDDCSHEDLAAKYREQINCRNIFFIWGNHDKKLRNSDKFKRLWTGTYDIANVTVEKQDIILCHYAFRTWDKSHRSTWNLYGHSHGCLPDDPTLLAFDVGVDCWNFCPLSFKIIQEIMQKRIAAGAGPTLNH
jgi:calcineurin-like phosphoesterase family protein